MIKSSINKRSFFLFIIVVIFLVIIYRFFFGGILNQKYSIYDLPDAMNALNNSWRYNQKEKNLVLKKWKKEHEKFLFIIAKRGENGIKMMKEYDRTYLKSYRNDANVIIQKEQEKLKLEAEAKAKACKLLKIIAKNRNKYKETVSKNGEKDLSEYLPDEYFSPECDSITKKELMIKAKLRFDPFSLEGLLKKIEP